MSVESRTSGTVAVADRNTGSNGADCEVVVIGAGPYGLSAAAHLKFKGVLVAAPNLMRCLPLGLRDKIRKRAGPLRGSPLVNRQIETRNIQNPQARYGS